MTHGQFDRTWSHGTARRVDTTVVVPTYNEGGNVAELVRRLTVALEGVDAEVLFVDDSSDDTPSIIRDVAARTPAVRLIHRQGADRVGGLAGAVTRGIEEARGDWVVVMDGDLQHPPELVPVMRAAAHRDGADMVVASRYLGEGDSSGLSSSWRRTVSGSSTLLARGLFPRRVGRHCTDPMTGFFCVARSSIELSRLRPRGFKILLEILASHDLLVREVPFVFGERFTGQSKASWRQGREFVHQLLSLRAGRVVRFAAVGLSGVLVNLGLMAALLDGGLHYVTASLLSTEVAIVSNFLLQERFVFHDQLGGSGWRRRVVQSFTFNNVENLARVPLLIALVEFVGLPSLGAAACALVLAFGARFLFASRVVYRPRPKESPEDEGVLEQAA